MYALQPAPEPRWEDVADDIRIRFRHGPTQALNAARRLIRQAQQAHAEAVQAGESVPEPDTDFLYVLGAAAWGAVAWEGVGEPGSSDTAEGGTVADLTLDALARLLSDRPDVFGRVTSIYVDPLVSLVAEKKGSGPSPNGISAAAPPIAGTSA